ALVLLGIGWNFLFVGGTTLLPKGYRDAERFRVQGLNDMLVFGAQATAALSAGAVLTSYGWASLVVVAIPLLILHSLFMAAWLLGLRTGKVRAGWKSYGAAQCQASVLLLGDQQRGLHRKSQ